MMGTTIERPGPRPAVLCTLPDACRLSMLIFNRLENPLQTKDLQRGSLDEDSD